jgi:hypothetical protein
MTTPAADRLIFAGNRLLKLWCKYVPGTFMQPALFGEGFQIVPMIWNNAYGRWIAAKDRRDCKRLAMVGRKSLDQLGTQPANQTPKQHLAAIRADRKARAQRQKPRLKKPITY